MYISCIYNVLVEMVKADYLLWEIPQKSQEITSCEACTTLYSRNCFYDHPLMQQKTVLKGRWSVKWGLLRHAHAKSILFFSSNLKERHFLNSRNALAAVYTDILHLCCSKFTKKVVPILHKPTTRYVCTLLWSHTQVHLHVSCSVHAKSGGRWSHCSLVVADDRDFSVQSDRCMEFRS